MKVALIQVSHARDAAYSATSIRSIQKFCSGFARICLFVPTRDRKVFEPLVGSTSADGVPVELIDYFEGAERGHWAHQHTICTADLFCPEADWIANLDSDSIFTRPVSPRDYFLDGKAVLLVAPYSENPNGAVWRAGVTHALGFEPEQETMQEPRLIHHRDVMAGLRRDIEKRHRQSFWHYSIQERLQPDGVSTANFAEFPCLGSFALSVPSLAKLYHTIQIGTEAHGLLPRFIEQSWTHYFSNPEYHANDLARLNKIIDDWQPA